jgi:hypothetical protein
MPWALFNREQEIALDELTQGNSSDRIIVIVGGAILDDSLRRSLDLRLRMGTSVKDKLFKVNGALGNLGAKIDIGYLLHMFEKPTRETLYGISEIRNFFAHNLVANFQSTDTRLSNAVNKLTLHQGRSHYPHPFKGQDSDIEIEKVNGQRDSFIVNLKLCLIELLADSSKHQHGSNFPT